MEVSVEKRRYVGKATVRIDGIGLVQPGDEIEVSAKVARELSDILVVPKPTVKKKKKPEQSKSAKEVKLNA